MKWLRHAVDRSFLNAAYLESTGPFLEDLRKDPQFQELLGEVKTRAKGLDFSVDR